MPANHRAAAFAIIGIVLLPSLVSAKDSLTYEDIFPQDRLLDVQITIPEESWDTLRRQTRHFLQALGAARVHTPPPTPYSYFDASVKIDGVEYPKVAIRKKGFLGSQSSSHPSLKVKLNHVDSEANIGGLTNLTLNNNQQDTSLVSQYLSYKLFNAIGSPAPRCAFAKVTVNGKYLGVYSHVESMRKNVVKRGFGDDTGTLFEGTVVDFYEGWENSFEHKFGDDPKGRARLLKLIEVLNPKDSIPLLEPDAEVRAFVPSDDSIDTTWMSPDFDDSSWIVSRGGAGFETERGYEKHIGENLEFREQLFERRGSIYLRYRFEAADFSKIRELLLGVKLDDGFVAYLNGHRVGSVNGPENPAWDSLATGHGDDRSAVEFQAIAITEHLDKLRKGVNVLAVQGLNARPESSDMLIAAELRGSETKALAGLEEVVDIDAFYRFWAIEGLLGFWDGYSGNRNNFFVYVHPETSKLHFLPWGADSLFMKFSPINRDPSLKQSVKIEGLLANRLYQTKAGRARYRKTLVSILEKHWNEEELLAEADRLEKLLEAAAGEHRRHGRFTSEIERIREFIRTRRAEILEEIADGMPIYTKAPSKPPLIPVREDDEDEEDDDEEHEEDEDDDEKLPANIWAAARGGHVDVLEELIDGGTSVDARDIFGTTAIGWAVALGQTRTVEFLIEAGANVNLPNLAGSTPLDTALTKLDEEGIELLEDLFEIEVDEERIAAAKPKIAEILRKRGAKRGKKPGEKPDESSKKTDR